MSIFFSLFFMITAFVMPEKKGHKFYISTTTIEYEEEFGTLQITSQLFIDDIEALLRKYEAELRLAPDSDAQRIDKLFELELKRYFRIKFDQEWVDFTFLGREYKNEILQCYLEVQVPETSQSLILQNRMLFELFEEQQHIIHFKNKGSRKSFLLHGAADTKTIAFQ